jgi:integrase
LQTDHIALRNYQDRLAQDEHARNVNPRYAGVSIDERFVTSLRDGIAGKLSDDELRELVGHRIEYFRMLGNTDAVFGSDGWRAMARGICISEYEALERVAERDEGIFSGAPKEPLLTQAAPIADDLPPVPIWKLFADYVASRELIGFQRDGGRRQKPVIESLVAFVKHQDARRLKRSDIREWRDDLMTKLSAKTVSDIYLSAVRSMLKWAVENERLSENVAETVRQPKGKRVMNREIGYTDAEALAILRASRSYESPIGIGGVREHAATRAAKRWVPLLCAFSGARVAEMTQLRKEDVRQEGSIYVLRITPDAGSVKSGGYRDVPIHQQVIDLGFLDFIASSSDGPLFNRSQSADLKAQRKSANRVGTDICEWLQASNLVPSGLMPNHAFRHRFKTTGREIGVSDRVLDAICGHASRTAGDAYGDVTITAKHNAISKFPDYALR